MSGNETNANSDSPQLDVSESLREALDKPSVLSNPHRISREEAFRNYSQFPTSSRTPALWKAFHVIVLNRSVMEFPTASWGIGSNVGSFRGEPDATIVAEFDEEDFWEDLGLYNVFDADIEDANGKLYELRIVFNLGDGDCNTGYWGKAFDRTDWLSSSSEEGRRPRVMAEILSYGDTETRIETTQFVKDEFQDHLQLSLLLDLMAEEGLGLAPGYSDCQFSFLVGMALACQTRDGNMVPAIYMRDGLPLQRTLLRTLAKSSGARAGNLVHAVLCESGPMQELIAEYSSEKYVSCSGEPDKSLDWYLGYTARLVDAVQIYQSSSNGDMNKAALEDALKKFKYRPNDEYDGGNPVIPFDCEKVDKPIEKLLEGDGEDNDNMIQSYFEKVGIPLVFYGIDKAFNTLLIERAKTIEDNWEFEEEED